MNTVSTLLEQKRCGDKITMLTAYDYTTAKIIDQCGVNSILVGDSLGMVASARLQRPLSKYTAEVSGDSLLCFLWEPLSIGVCAKSCCLKSC